MLIMHQQTLLVILLVDLIQWQLFVFPNYSFKYWEHILPGLSESHESKIGIKIQNY